MTETFGERIARLCVDRAVTPYRIMKTTGVRVDQLDRSKTVSLKVATGIASALRMTIAEVNAPIALTIGTAQAVELGLIADTPPPS